MSAEQIQGIISIIIIIVIVLFLAKKAIKLAISIFVILILFNIAFIWNGDILNEKLGLDKFLKPEAATSVTEFFNDFANKRDEYGVMVDADAVYEQMTDAIETGTDIIIKGLGQVNIKKFADTLSEKIYDIGADNIDWDQLKNEIKKQLDGIKDEDADKIIEEVKTNIEEKESK